jgi:hypothetical protein
MAAPREAGKRFFGSCRHRRFVSYDTPLIRRYSSYRRYGIPSNQLPNSKLHACCKRVRAIGALLPEGLSKEILTNTTQTHPKYMIDFNTYQQMHPSKSPQPLASDAEMREQGVDIGSDDPPASHHATPNQRCAELRPRLAVRFPIQKLLASSSDPNRPASLTAY